MNTTLEPRSPRGRTGILVHRQTIGSRSGARCADGLHSPNRVTRSQLAPYPLVIDHGVCSSASPHHRSCSGRTESFPSSDENNHHQINQIHGDWSRIGLRNPPAASRILLSLLLFCHSSLSNDDVLRKASCGTPLTCGPRYHRIPSWTRAYLRVRIEFAGPCTCFCYDV
jgi:hypothetical protein